jgi:hypothetical protein
MQQDSESLLSSAAICMPAPNAFLGPLLWQQLPAITPRSRQVDGKHQPRKAQLCELCLKQL